MAVDLSEKKKKREQSRQGKKSTSRRSLVSSSRAHWEKAYALPESEIPWEIEEPPRELVRLLENGRLRPCNALDVACGSGNYSIYLARRGFDVTGVDFSKTALVLAKKKMEKSGLQKRVHLVHGDVRHLLDALAGQKFGFVLDWSLLHHIAPRDFADYAKQFSKLLVPGGFLLLACFSDADASKLGVKKAVGKMGNVMHYRTRKHIEAAYRSLTVLQYRECWLGKKRQHPGHCFW